MKLAIIGHEAAKFTEDQGLYAVLGITEYLCAIRSEEGDPIVVSGGCHLGGVDVWAEEAAAALGLRTEIYRPAKLNWAEGFKPRNLKIAEACDECLVIVVRDLPPTFKGMRFEFCYHCARNPDGCKEPHVKSGACWTEWQAQKLGKPVRWVVVPTEPNCLENGPAVEKS